MGVGNIFGGIGSLGLASVGQTLSRLGQQQAFQEEWSVGVDAISSQTIAVMGKALKIDPLGVVFPKSESFVQSLQTEINGWLKDTV